MGASRENYLTLLDDERVGVFCAYGVDFMPFRARILDENLFMAHSSLIKKCVFMNQIHSNEVLVYENQSLITSCDGLITRQKGVALCVLSADCLPLLLCGGGFVAALHSGRKGSFENILQKAVLKMQELDKSLRTDELSLFIAPSICAKNYAISGELLDFARLNFNAFLYDDKLDLKALIKAQAIELGIKDIKDSQICSFDDERFFSYRKDKTEQRFVSVIYLK